jgi:hypothetical protein
MQTASVHLTFLSNERAPIGTGIVVVQVIGWWMDAVPSVRPLATNLLGHVCCSS